MALLFEKKLNFHLLTKQSLLVSVLARGDLQVQVKLRNRQEGCNYERKQWGAGLSRVEWLGVLIEC